MPSLNVNLSVVDFLLSLEVPLIHKKLYLGDIVRTEYDWKNRVSEGKILEYTRNYFEKQLTLQRVSLRLSSIRLLHQVMSLIFP